MSSSSSRPSWAVPLISLALLGGLLFGVRLAIELPAPAPSSAPSESFSAGRAKATLESLIQDLPPHPAGSPAGATLVERLRPLFHPLGLKARIERRMSCGLEGSCVLVRNVVARRPGTTRKKAILLSTHHDSRAAAPGASDAGAGMASILEVLRALKDVPLERPIEVLINDGEELGLVGAHAYVQEDPKRWSEIAWILNLEARGTSGPVLMFETSAPNEDAVRAFADAVERPAATSLFETVYRFLPNGTDLTVFRHHKGRGLGFAFLGDPLRYHTPQDNLENLDPQSLQHMGDQALQMLRTLDKLPDQAPTPARRVYFDVLRRTLISWREGTGQGLAILLLFVSLLLVAKAPLPPPEAEPEAASAPPSRSLAFAFGLLGLLATLALGGLLGVGLDRGLKASGAIPFKWVQDPHPALGAHWALGLFVAFLVLPPCLRRAGEAMTRSVHISGLAILGVVTAFSLPGSSYLFLAPALGLVLTRALFGFLRPAESSISTPERALSLALWCGIYGPLLDLLYQGLGFWIPGLHTLVALSFLLFLPSANPPRSFCLLPLGLALAAALLQVRTPPYAIDHPRPFVFLHQEYPQRESAKLHAIAEGGLSEGFREANGFLETEARSRALKARFPVYSRPVPRAQLLPPQVRGLEWTSSIPEGDSPPIQTLRLKIESRRGAWQYGIAGESRQGLVRIRVQGETIDAAAIRSRGHAWALPIWLAPGLTLELELDYDAIPEGGIQIWDESLGLPLETARFFVRPDLAVPAHQGDRTQVFFEFRPQTTWPNLEERTHWSKSMASQEEEPPPSPEAISYPVPGTSAATSSSPEAPGNLPPKGSLP